jgi:3',5'-cyclic AMP phosphodiesterase CpdA
MPRPFVLVQLSDPHIGGEWGIGDPAARLEAAVAAAAELRPDAAVVTGDLADHAEAGELEVARDLLGRLGVAAHVLPGNHDGRAALRRCFGLPGEGEDPVRYDADLGPLRLIALDTMRPGHDDGMLDGEQLGWLDGALSAAPGTPTVIAMHHPPIPMGLPLFDAMGLDDAGRRGFEEVVARHPQVLRVIAGHVHRPVTGSAGGRAALTAPSTYVQLRLNLEGADRVEPVPEPLGFAVHVVTGGEIASHVQTFAAPPEG